MIKIGKLLKPLYKIWMTLSGIISWITTRVILSILFYLVVTPIGIISRLFRGDFLGLKFEADTADSYWIPKEKKEFKKEDYERQF